MKFNGFANLYSANIKRQYKCNACSQTWVVPVHPEYDRLLPIHKLREKDWKAIQQFVMGSTGLEVEKTTRVKQQTFKKKLRAIFKKGLWSDFKPILLKKMGENIWDDEIDQLYNNLREDSKGKTIFRRIGQLKK